MAYRGWQIEIRLELLNIYREDAQDLALLLTFLDNQARDNPGAATNWTTLRVMWERGLPEQLRAYTDNIIRDETRRRFNNVRPAIANGGHAGHHTGGNANSHAPGIRINMDPNFAVAIYQFIQSNEGAALGFGAGLAQVWDTLPHETHSKLIENIAQICGRQIGNSHCLAVANNFSGTKAMYSIAICVIVVKCWVNVTRWYKGELSGKRCAQQCVNLVVEYGAGFLGAFGGAALGAMVNPFLAAFLGAFGGVVSATAAKVLIGRLTEQVFDLQVDIATENAYRFMEIDHNATPQQIHVAYEAMMIRNQRELNQQERQRLGIMLNINMTIIQNDQRNRLGQEQPHLMVRN